MSRSSDAHEVTGCKTLDRIQSESDMKRLLLALATGMIALTGLSAPQAQAGGGFGLHLSPVFIPTPRYHGRRLRRHSWDFEGRYERRKRRARARRRLLEIKRRRAAAAKRRRLEAARRRAAEARRLARVRKEAARRKAEKEVAVKTPTENTVVSNSPPVPAKKTTTVATAPVPTEALLTKQEAQPGAQKSAATVAASSQAIAKPSTIAPVEIEKSASTSGANCKKFLPGPGLTISVPCEK